MPCESLCRLHFEQILLESLHREWQGAVTIHSIAWHSLALLSNSGLQAWILLFQHMVFSRRLTARCQLRLNHGLNCGSFPSPSIHLLKMSCKSIDQKPNHHRPPRSSILHFYGIVSWLLLVKTSATWVPNCKRVILTQLFISKKHMSKKQVTQTCCDCNFIHSSQ